MQPDQAQHPDTLSVHAGHFVTPANAGASPPLYQAAAYRFRDLDDVEAVYSGEVSGAIYGRYGGPNGSHFASAVAELEGAEAAFASSNGMSAIDAALAVSTGPGETIVATRDIYGGTYELLIHQYAAPRANVIFVDQTNLAEVEAVLQRTKASVFYIEALTNPLMRVADFPALASICKKTGTRFIVDATFATPVLVRPLDYGADIVLHSATKYLGGHGDVGAGVAAGSATHIDSIRKHLIRNGATVAHFDAWLAMRGIRTLSLRMERHSANAAALAAYLETQAAVTKVHHPSLVSHPQHTLARKLYPRGTGGMLAFDLNGGRNTVDRFLRGLRRIEIVHSLGEVATTIGYSAVSSHRGIPEALRHELGVTEGTLRLSAGIEHSDDLIADLEHAFAGLSSHIPA
jgi:cystathionine gamma-synthase